MSIHKKVAKIVSEHPDIHTSLQRGIVNYSALARYLCALGDFPDDVELGSIIIALQRITRKKEDVHDYKDFLRRSELEIKTKMAVIIVNDRPAGALEKNIREKGGYFQAIQGRDVTTIITNENHVGEVVDQCTSVVKKREHLVLFTLISPKDIESMPGVVSYLYSLLAIHGINVVETMSCWTDTLFVVHKDDLSRVTQILS